MANSDVKWGQVRFLGRDFRPPRDVARTRKLNPRLQTFAQWLEHNIARMVID